MDDIYFTMINQLRSFVKYLLSVWGILSAISPYFPHYDKLKILIPPPENNTLLCT